MKGRQVSLGLGKERLPLAARNKAFGVTGRHPNFLKRSG